MKTSFKTMMMAFALAGSMSATAAPPGRGRDANENGIPDRFEQGGRRARMLYVVSYLLPSYCGLTCTLFLVYFWGVL